MPIKIEGEYPGIQRVETGLYSFDLALANPIKHELGMPLRTIIELVGPEGIGKSTLAYYLTGAVNKTGKVVLCDFEGMDIAHLPVAMATSGFDGSVKIVREVDAKGKIRPHENMLDEVADTIRDDEEVTAALVDSIGAIRSISEEENGIEEGMGAKRATLVARFSRKSNSAILTRKNPMILFATNHAHVIVSGHGHLSSGGVTMKYLEAVRFFLRQSAADNIKSGDEVLAYCLTGVVEKLRYGGKGRSFKVMLISGQGIRKNLTAMQDCVTLGLAERGAMVKVEGNIVGRVSELVEADLAGQDKKFDPFYEALVKARQVYVGN